MVVAVRVGGYHQNLWLVEPEHFGGICINRYLPFFRKNPTAFFIRVATRNKNAGRVGVYRSGVGAGLFPQAVFFEKACNPAQANDGGFYFFHAVKLSQNFLVKTMARNSEVKYVVFHP
jgi:hypothetical protein